MKKLIPFLFIISLVAFINFKFSSIANFDNGTTLSFSITNANAQTEGGGPSSCGIVCCDWNPLVFPPTHVRCQIICVPQYFCIANGGSSILCDFMYVTCSDYCSNQCSGSS